jgi:hypothetical protein
VVSLVYSTTKQKYTSDFSSVGLSTSHSTTKRFLLMGLISQTQRGGLPLFEFWNGAGAMLMNAMDFFVLVKPFLGKLHNFSESRCGLIIGYRGKEP